MPEQMQVRARVRNLLGYAGVDLDRAKTGICRLIEVEVTGIGSRLMSASALDAAGLPCDYPFGEGHDRGNAPIECAAAMRGELSGVDLFVTAQPGPGTAADDEEWVCRPAVTMTLLGQQDLV